MPHLSRELKISPGPVVAPIPGNTGAAGAINDGNGQALYAVLNGGDFQVWRTRAGYLSLLQYDGSVDYLATIAVGPFKEPASAGLNRIGGVLYAVVHGMNTATLKAGTWVYRDTSTAANGSGPWVLHGTVIENNVPAEQDGGGTAGGEILVSGGLWVVNHKSFGVGSRASSQGVSTSSDGGVTWTLRLDDGFFFVGSPTGLRWSRNFAQWGGAWYVGGVGQVDSKVYKSADLITWTNLGPLNFAAYPISTPSLIYRASGDLLEYASAAPESNPPWVSVLNGVPNTGGSFTHYANISTPTRPVFAAFAAGKTMRVSTSLVVAPPCRQYPREDGLATSSAPRMFPQARSQQGGLRQAGGTYY